MQTSHARTRVACWIVIAAAWLIAYVTALSAARSAVQVDLATRVDSDGNRSLLVEVQSSSIAEVDGILIKLPGSSSSVVFAPLLPGEWTVSQEGQALRLAGPPAALPLRARLSLGASPAPAHAEVVVMFGNRPLHKAKLQVREIPPIQVIRSLQDLLILPPLISPGEHIEVELLGGKKVPSGSRWVIGGALAEPAGSGPSPGRAVGKGLPIAAGEVSRGPRFTAHLPETLQPGAPLGVSYLDPWGERIVDVPAAEGVRVVPRQEELAVAPRIVGCGTHTLAGDVLCVCGFFPLSSWMGFTIDGKPAGRPLSASRRVVYLRVPPGLQPGMHMVAGHPDQGFHNSDQVAAVLLSVRGDIDRGVLMPAETARVRLVVEGSEEKIPLQLVNRTPEVVSLEGGNQQVAVSTGGSPNLLERRVNALRRGKFDIGYRLETRSCPCAASEEARPDKDSREIVGSPPSPVSQSRGRYLPGQILAIVSLPPSQSLDSVVQDLAITQGLEVLGSYPLVSIGEALAVFKVPGGLDLFERIASLEADPRVRSAQPNFLHETAGLKGDSYSQLQYAPKLIHRDLLPSSATGEGVKVGLIDTGVDAGHFELKDGIIEPFDVTEKGFTPDIHGTLLAGILAAKPNNGAGIDGIAPRVRLLAVKACQPLSSQAIRSLCPSLALARALDLAIQKGVAVLNLSIAGVRDKLVARLLRAALQRGVVVVAAAGNDGPQASAPFPAALDGVIAATAVDAAEQLYHAATRGLFIALAAPGVEIVSTAPGNQFLVFSGTSAAAAFVSGAVALLLQQKPGLSPQSLRSVLEQTAKELGRPGKDPEFGSGLLDICRAWGELAGIRASCR